MSSSAELNASMDPDACGLAAKDSAVSASELRYAVASPFPADRMASI